MNSAAEVHPPWYRSTLAIALAGSLLCWAALPPLGLGWLAWIAPVPWLLLVRAGQLPEGRPYGALWTAGFAFWILTLQWLRLPHPATSLGWLALSAYLACYLPAFVGLSRVAVHRLGVPLWLAAPVVWTGLEFLRAHLFTGFLTASLAHTQTRWTTLIQISDLVGEYGVGFLVMLVAACVAGGLRIADCGLRIQEPNLQSENRTSKLVWSQCRPAALIPAVLAIAAVVGYGHWRLRSMELVQAGADSQPPGPRIALIQGNSLAEWKHDPERERQIMDEYVELSERAVALARKRGDGRPVDLVIWPETMFRSALVTFEAGYRLPPEVTRTPEEIAAIGPRDLASLVRRLGTPVLVGVERAHFESGAPRSEVPPAGQRYNSAVLVGRDGEIVSTYDKIHRVMFGEYIPFAEWLPALYRFTPLTGGIQAGAEPAAMKLDDVIYTPNICYETTLPHVIRRQVARLDAQKKRPDVLVNLTNDAWYWGSSALDLHLASGVFRAVEMRRPLVIAANGGISAWIDHSGRIRAESPRQQTDFVLADVERTAMRSLYIELGDWFAGVCLTCCVVLAIVGWKADRELKKTRRQGDKETRR